MIDIENKTNIIIDQNILEVIANEISKKDIDLMLVDNKMIREYNKQYRDKDEPTDVLSFPIDEDMPYAPLGSIVISLEYANNVATKLSHGLNDEISLLLIHGILHLLGYDHEVDNGEMRDKEKEWIEYFKLPSSLITRNTL
jgi:probable rRNA maturation factor